MSTNSANTPIGGEAPQSFSEYTVYVRDHTTSIRDSGGNGAPVILLHALSLDSHMWTHGVFEKLVASQTAKAAARRVIAYDLRGHGRAQDAPRITSIPQLADDLRELFTLLKIDKADVIGVSFGGAVAQAFTLAYPECVRSTGLIATFSDGNEILAARASDAEANGMQSMVEKTLSRWFLPENIQADKECVRFARDHVKNARLENWADSWRAAAALKCLDLLGTITTPILLIAGTQDTSTPPAMMKQMLEKCKTADYKEIESGMHLFVMENPDPVSVELGAFLYRMDQTEL